MHKTLSFILAITVLARLCDAICDPMSFDSLPQARVPTAWRSKQIEIINNDNNAYLCRYVDCRVISTRYCTCYTTSQELSNPQSQSCFVIGLQCVTLAACCGGGTCSAQGSRSCKLESSMQSLFVWNVVSGQLQFEMFEFPAYCACKSN